MSKKMTDKNKEAIERLSLMQERCCNGYDAEAIYLAKKALENERPQGEWIMEDKPFGGFGDSVLAITCSICKTSYVYRNATHNFCSNCGADMRGNNK